MSDFDRLFKRASQIANDEGLFKEDPTGRRKALPDVRDAEIDLASARRVVERLAAEEVPNLPDISTAQAASSVAPRRLEPFNPDPAIQAPDTKQDLRVSIAKTEIIIKEQINFLAEWYDINSNFAKKDRTRYWLLKIPALVSTVSVSALEAFGYGQAVIIMGVIAAFCVGIDAAFPGGQLHNIHKRAANQGLVTRNA